MLFLILYGLGGKELVICYVRSIRYFNLESLSEKVLNMLTNQKLYERIKVSTHCPKQFAPDNVMRKIDALLEDK